MVPKISRQLHPSLHDADAVKFIEITINNAKENGNLNNAYQY